MPHVFEWDVPVWQTDLDGFAELRASALVRLLQETATRASTDAGFDAAYYERVGGMWLVRRTVLARPVPVRYGETLRVRTWVADVRRERSERRYEVWSSGRLVADAATDWVYVDRHAARPRRVPPDLADVLGRDGTPLRTRDRRAGDAPPPDADRSERRVEAHELDALRHVNNAAYLHWIEQAVLDACAATGRHLRAAGRLRATGYDVEYLDAAVGDDRVALAAWPAAVGSTEVAWRTRAIRLPDARVLVDAATTWTWTVHDAAAPLPVALAAVLRDRLPRGAAPADELRAPAPSDIVPPR